jgi:hypothetical protein
MLDPRRKSKYLSSTKVMGLSLYVNARRTFQDMDRYRPIGVVLLQLCPGLHCDEQHTEIVGLEKQLGIQA